MYTLFNLYILFHTFWSYLPIHTPLSAWVIPDGHLSKHWYPPSVFLHCWWDGHVLLKHSFISIHTHTHTIIKIIKFFLQIIKKKTIKSLNWPWNKVFGFWTHSVKKNFYNSSLTEKLILFLLTYPVRICRTYTFPPPSVVLQQ